MIGVRLRRLPVAAAPAAAGGAQPQLAHDTAVGGLAVPQRGQISGCGAAGAEAAGGAQPQLKHEAAPGGLAVPHCGQINGSGTAHTARSSAGLRSLARIFWVSDSVHPIRARS